jgi:hypothetical protein
MSTTNTDDIDVSDTGKKSLSSTDVRAALDIQGYGANAYDELVEEGGWTDELIMEKLITYDDEKPEEADDDTSEEEAETFENAPDFIHNADPVQVEAAGVVSWHVDASATDVESAMETVAENMGVPEGALGESRLWVIRFSPETAAAVYPDPDGVGFRCLTPEGETIPGASEAVPTDWLTHTGRQSQWLPDLATTVANHHGQSDLDFVKNCMSNALSHVESVLSSDEELEFFEHPDSGALVSNTREVQAIFSTDGIEHRVKITAPEVARLPPGTTATLTFDGQAWASKSAAAVKKAYATAFGVELDMSDEMASLVYAEWEQMKEVRTAADLALETLVDDFTSSINRMQVSPVEDVRDWSPSDPTGLLYTDGDEEFVAVGSTWVRDLFDSDAQNLERRMDEALVESGVVCDVDRASGTLYEALNDAEGVDNPRPMVWVIPIGKTSQDAEEIRNAEKAASDILGDDKL